MLTVAFLQAWLSWGALGVFRNTQKIVAGLQNEVASFYFFLFFLSFSFLFFFSWYRKGEEEDLTLFSEGNFII